MISHANVMSQCHQMKALIKPGSQDVLLSPLSLFHSKPLSNWVSNKLQERLITGE